jgi:hypothetical protein
MTLHVDMHEGIIQHPFRDWHLSIWLEESSWPWAMAVDSAAVHIVDSRVHKTSRYCLDRLFIMKVGNAEGILGLSIPLVQALRHA